MIVRNAAIITRETWALMMLSWIAMARAPRVTRTSWTRAMTAAAVAVLGEADADVEDDGEQREQDCEDRVVPQLLDDLGADRGGLGHRLGQVEVALGAVLLVGERGGDPIAEDVLGLGRGAVKRNARRVGRAHEGGHGHVAAEVGGVEDRVDVGRRVRVLEVDRPARAGPPVLSKVATVGARMSASCSSTRLR